MRNPSDRLQFSDGISIDVGAAEPFLCAGLAVCTQRWYGDKPGTGAISRYAKLEAESPPRASLGS